ncbi:MAG: glutamate 5-kinase [Rhodospirillaceae bacterium]|jgi:glutamate 5-kinase|nr:glutamate 5-kinase [Rhodospirillaceae bacterium]MBT5239123.1 glutamate 5-kinase [Rhodospirillaceae bacterium]MBT5564866.1 glutamate 5-kinase [Rhodospirillaceae bacterium]MBT6089170.1 glutamate 5-kinase [Rhodospirillaceae bacterium]MBT7449646.1 glutamate 5-kinase [Rhodospirillaceae bacterium]
MVALTTPDIAKAERVVVKIGSVLLVDEATGALHRSWLDAVCDDIAAMRARGQDVVVVTSGAIAIGRGPLNLTSQSLRLEEKQAAAATGQVRLTQAYQESLGRHDLTVAQVLLTVDDTEDRRRFLNARTTLDTLLQLGAIPVINENDTVATTEIRFGDNDRLAARVAAMIGADACILLSDVDGLYASDPTDNPDAEHRPQVKVIDDAVRAMAATAKPGHGTGGMVTKLMAADICMAAGCHMAIALGTVMRPLDALENGALCTWFVSAAEPRAARKKWIAGTLNPTGKLVVDDGAAKALSAGKSLLPAGVIDIEGEFGRGDAVVIVGQDGSILGKGLSAFSAEDARRIKGHRSDALEGILGYQGRSEVVHRDDLVLNT